MTARAWPGVKPGSGNARILDHLADERWHSTFELQVGCDTMAHSRLAELRKAHYVIGKRRVPGGTGLRMFEWRLESVPPLAEPGLVSSSATDGEFLSGSGSASGVGSLGPVAPVLPDVAHLEREDGQLALAAA